MCRAYFSRPRALTAASSSLSMRLLREPGRLRVRSGIPESAVAARSGDRAYRTADFGAFPVGRVPTRGALVAFPNTLLASLQQVGQRVGNRLGRFQGRGMSGVGDFDVGRLRVVLSQIAGT